MTPTKGQNVNQQPSNVRYLKPMSSIPNPFRPGSKKAICFELFLRGGRRDELIRKMRRTGIAELTARTWISIFRLYCHGVRAGRQSEPADSR
jgi:hypothetical protein